MYKGCWPHSLRTGYSLQVIINFVPGAPEAVTNFSAAGFRRKKFWPQKAPPTTLPPGPPSASRTLFILNHQYAILSTD